jgi:hypothetical protein
MDFGILVARVGERVGPLGRSRCGRSDSHDASYREVKPETGFLLGQDAHHSGRQLAMSNTCRQPIDSQGLMVVNGFLNYG